MVFKSIENPIDASKDSSGQSQENVKEQAPLENDESTQEQELENPERRSFLKGVVGGGAAYAVMEKFDLVEPVVDALYEWYAHKKEMPQEYWFEAIEGIYDKLGTDNILYLCAKLLVDALGIPSGETSALSGDREADQKIAERLTNVPGMQMDRGGLISCDFRDIYENSLPQDLLNIFEPRTQEIFKAEYELETFVKNTDQEENNELLGNPVNYFRLPGGVDVFLQGYSHSSAHQKKYGEYYANIAKHAQVIAIEGATSESFSESLNAHYSKSAGGHYDLLMRDIVAQGFEGYFSEVDARDTSKVSLDSHGDPSNEKYRHFEDLPDRFYETYFNYLEKENTQLALHIGNAKQLKDFLRQQSTSSKGKLSMMRRGRKHDGKGYIPRKYFTEQLKGSSRPTGFEFGQVIFTDALAAIKIHVMARLMNENAISKGPIVDFEGSAHLSSKQFFMRYPEYAMQVVLRCMPELLASDAEVKENNDATAVAHMQKITHDIDWGNVVRKVAYVPFMKPVGNELKKYPHKDDRDFALDALDVNPKKVIPDDNMLAGTVLKLAIKKSEKEIKSIKRELVELMKQKESKKNI